MSRTRWSEDTFLDSLRKEVDVRADDCVRRLVEENGLEGSKALFRHASSNDPTLPDDAPAAMREFFATTADLPPGVDLARVDRGERVWMRHAFPAALVLLAKALPEGYAAPSFGEILHLTHDLERHPYRRLLGVMQMVVNVCNAGGFEEGGKAVVSAQKMRLLHAAIRTHIVPRSLPDYDPARFGPPVNFEDMLATVMGFSYLVVDGLSVLGTPLADDETEDLYYVWRVFAQVVGLHPPGQPESDAWVPGSVAEAAEFYQSYARRHYVGPEENPKGVVLARDNLEMLKDLLPRSWRALGLGILPRIYMQDLMGPEGCARVGIRPVFGHGLLKRMALAVVRLSHRAVDKVPERMDDTVSRLFFQGLINRSWKGEVTFLIPDTLADVRRLA
jgi:hypothetical protein